MRHHLLSVQGANGRTGAWWETRCCCSNTAGIAVDSTGAADAAFDGCFLLPKKERKNSNKRIPISSWITIYQRKTGSPRPTKSRPRVKYSGFNFARGSESPFVHCTQPYGFACQPLRGLVTSRNGELSIKKDDIINNYQNNVKWTAERQEVGGDQQIRLWISWGTKGVKARFRTSRSLRTRCNV